MHWIISAAGLAILFLLAWGTHRPAPRAYRDATLDDALPAHLKALAAETEGRGRTRIRMPRGLLGSLERSVRFLNALPTQDLLPAARWLCDNGRFLQEEIASLRLALEGTPRLPRCSSGVPRVILFAREVMGHSTAAFDRARLERAVDAWQSVTPFTVEETDCLPLALRLTLLELICASAGQCVHEQKARLCAVRMDRLLRHGRERQAQRLFKRNEHESAFLEQLLSQVRAGEEAGRALWLDRYFDQHGLSADGLAESEHAHQAESCLWVSNAVTSLRAIGRMPWQRVLEGLSAVHASLCADRVYCGMDQESRAYYRSQVSRIAERTGRPELSVCAGALSLAQGGGEGVRGHVGYYLLDDGLRQLLRYLQAPRAKSHSPALAAGLLRLSGWAALAALLSAAWALGLPWPVWPLFAVVFFCAAQRAAAVVLLRRLRPRMVPRMQVDQLDASTQTLVVCPTMLMDAAHAISMVKHLSVLHQANPDPHLHFLLLGDFQDSLTGTLSGDGDIVAAASAAVRALCEDTGHPFFYLQRERVFSTHDHLYMSRERKRGSLETLLRLIDGRPVEDSFAYASLPLESLKGRYRYVITLDSDTILPPGSALRLVGGMLHPLQRREKVQGRMRGVSVLQPRMEIAAHTVGSRLSLLLGGRGGADPYNALAPDLSQDLYRRGTFMGKGIIDPAPFLDATEHSIIPGCVLSHDLLEGELAGCAMASDTALYDGNPRTLKGFLYRLHRWTRGDWQLLPYVFPLFPSQWRPPRRTLDAVARRKIRHNLLRSLVAPLRIALIAYAAAAGRPWLVLCALVLPELPYVLPAGLRGLAPLVTRLALLPCEAGMQADAIARTLYRLWFSRRHLLAWTTAAQLSRPSDKPPMLFFYLSMLTGAAVAGLSLLPGGTWAGLAVGALWAAFPFALPYLEQPAGKSPRPTGYMREVLTRVARGTLTFFETAITDADHALPPDNVQIEPNKGVSHRTSPTNIGLYLCALAAAERLRPLPPDEMADRMEQTVATLEALPKWQGHLYNWYDTRTLEPLEPPFISSVDSGNLAACLLTCAQGVRVLLPHLSACYHSLAARMDALAEGMRFSALFDAEADLFRIGVHPAQESPSAGHYDLLASESRLLSFVAIMLGQVPVRHWYRLGRLYTRVPGGGQALISSNGTMFEYLMPLLFQPAVHGTLLDGVYRAAVKVQKRWRRGGVFGVSESGYYAFDPNLYYLYKAFGMPRLSLDPDQRCDVITPYATFLALSVDLKGSFQNLLRLMSLGMEGPLGMFEAADFSPARTDGQPMRIVRSHMAHHQGMILLAVCNVLEEGYIAGLFSFLPRAQAYRLLLEEKAFRARGLIRHPLRRTARETPPSAAAARRAAQPLRFPIDAHLLHGAGTTWMIDAQGGGFVSRNGVMLTRFTESCRLPSGMRFYLRDSQSGAYWNVTDPGLTQSVSFETAQAVFSHERFQVESQLRLFVNPLDGTALACLTLKNNSGMERMMEVCSYLEPALASQRDDAAHPAFQNLFLRTGRLGKYGVAAMRRPRGPSEEGRRLWHLMATDASLTLLRVQTDRAAFLGRGRTVYAPRALEMPISAIADTLGDVIEPCLSLRGQFVLPPGGRLQFVFATLLPGESDAPGAFLERYGQVDGALRAYGPALTRGLVTARYLGLSAGMLDGVSRLVGPLCYTGQPAQLRYAAENSLPLSALWSMGISGDLPILLLECREGKDLSLVQLLLRAHAWYRMHGLWVDLVLAVTQPSGYDHPLRERLSALAQSCHSHELIGRESGVHLFDNLTADQLGLLRAAARVVLSTDGGSLEEQLHALEVSMRVRPLYTCRPSAEWKPLLPEADAMLFDNGYGGFTRDGGNYRITLPAGRQTPAPWCNPLCSEHFGTLAGESGLLFTYAGNSHSGRLTRWPNDGVTPRGEENFFLRDDAHRLLWSLTRQPMGHNMPVRVTHAPGETVYECSCYGVYCRMSCFTDGEAAIGARVIQLRNEDRAARTLTLMHTCIFSPGTQASAAQLTALSRAEGGILAQNPCMEGVAGLFGIDPPPSLSTTMSSGVFQGLWGVAPAALCGGANLPSDFGDTAVLCYEVRLRPGETRTITTALAHAAGAEALLHALAGFARDGATLRLHAVRQQWEERLSVLRFDLPDPAMALMLGRWLPYQVQASRLWMRAGFYQAGGALGFRDQLQDMLSLLHTRPDAVRAHLVECAAHQFEEGDVQHWWHPPRYGVRTRISDDKLFLPYVTALYVQVTGDTAVLSEEAPYLHGEPLADTENERLFVPEVSEISEPLRLHCLRAIDHVACGAHGLPLMGGSDWNDGMNRVGGENGESVWLGMFLCEVLRLFAPLCEPPETQRLLERREALLTALDRYAWDGGWYLRAWYDDGSRLGSAANEECRIDLLPQAWGVLCGVSRDRCALAMDNAWRMLYEPDVGLMKLFTPPFQGQEQPGYIAAYLPGVRENGGQYTHAACWAVAALHQLGQDGRAWELASALLPIRHAATRQLALRYRVEPYALAADVYANPQQRGRGGWTWYTGSASWLQYVVLTQLLGFQKTGSVLRFRPVAPAEWDGLRVTYRFGTATYHLHASRDCPFPTADGEQLRDGRLILTDDGRIHEATFPLR